MTERHQETLKVVLARLVTSGAIPVLDLGCGPGQRRVRLADYPHCERIVGLDVSPTAIAQLRNRLEERGPRLLGHF